MLSSYAKIMIFRHKSQIVEKFRERPRKSLRCSPVQGLAAVIGQFEINIFRVGTFLQQTTVIAPLYVSTPAEDATDENCTVQVQVPHLPQI